MEGAPEQCWREAFGKLSRPGGYPRRPARRKRYVDFTYQHHTVSGGLVAFGGLETGTRDAKASENLARLVSPGGNVFRRGGNALLGAATSARADGCGARDTAGVPPAVSDAAEARARTRRYRDRKVPDAKQRRAVVVDECLVQSLHNGPLEKMKYISPAKDRPQESPYCGPDGRSLLA